MADYSVQMPQFEHPDLLGQYLRGVSAPGQLQAQQQALQEGQLNIDQLRLAAGTQQMDQTVYRNQLQQMGMLPGGQPQAQPQVPPGSPGQPSAGARLLSQGAQAMGTPSAPAGGGLFTNPSFAAAAALAHGKDPTEAFMHAQDAGIKLTKLQLQGPINLARGLMSDPDADITVSRNPSLMAGWQQYAPRIGADPNRPSSLTPANAQKAAAMWLNDMNAQIGESAVSMPEHLSTSYRRDGSIVQQDPLKGTITEPVKADLKQVIGDNGPVLMPSTQAAGKTPYNATIFGATNISDQEREFAYQFARQNGGKLPPNMNYRSDAAKSAIAGYVAKRANEDGDSATAMIARGQQTAATQKVLNDFESGPTSKSLNAINTSVKHIDTLKPLVEALGTGDYKQVNRLSNLFKEQTGNPAPTNVAEIKQFVGGEIAKAVLPGGGGEHERDALLAPLNSANSPQAIGEALDLVQKALAGKTDAYKLQWDTGTQGNQGDFNRRFLLPETRKALGITSQPQSNQSAHPADIQAILDKVNQRG